MPAKRKSTRSKTKKTSTRSTAAKKAKTPGVKSAGVKKVAKKRVGSSEIDPANILNTKKRTRTVKRINYAESAGGTRPRKKATKTKE